MYTAPDYVKVSTKVHDIFGAYCVATVDYGGIFNQGQSSCGNNGVVTVMRNMTDVYAIQCWATPPRA